MNILAIETSCDETAVAVIKDGTKIISEALSSSSDLLTTWGGIVPELAARRQLSAFVPVLIGALGPLGNGTDTIMSTIKNSIDRIAVTVGPGLNGSLLVGIEAAKTIAGMTGLPLVPVNHVLAHMYANFVQPDHTKAVGLPEIRYPAVSLVVSGGHTELFRMDSPSAISWLGGTVDDAAGEAFDKSARLLGLGAGGGKAIEDAALLILSSTGKTDDTGPSAPIFPRPLIRDGSYKFSFSGLKTAIQREWKKLPEKTQEDVVRFSFQIQETITDVLVAKTLHAASDHRAESILLSGGVAANGRLRQKMRRALDDQLPAASLHVPPVRLCTDNAVYIGAYAYFRGKAVDWHTVDAEPDMSVEV